MRENLKKVDLYNEEMAVEISQCEEKARIGGKQPRWQEIKYNAKDEAFITKEKHRVYLHHLQRA